MTKLDLNAHASPQAPNSAPLGVLIVGYGLSGRIFHGALLSSLPHQYQVKGIVTSSPDKIEVAKADFPQAKLYAQEALGEALENSQIHLVIISTPNSTHTDLALKSLANGKHVLIEKPFAPTAEEAAQILAAAAEADRFVCVYQNRRFDGDFLTLQQVISEGLVGRPVALESRFDRFRPRGKGVWKEKALPGSGILFDLGSHLIDQANTLFGKPSQVYADIRKQRGSQEATDDAFELILDYPENSVGAGVKVTLMAGNFVNYPTPRFVLLGDKGSYVHYGMDPQEEALRAGKRPYSEEAKGLVWGARNEGDYGIFYPEGYPAVPSQVVPTLPGDYRRFFNALYLAITSGNADLLPVKPEEALATIEIIEGARSQGRH